MRGVRSGGHTSRSHFRRVYSSKAGSAVVVAATAGCTALGLGEEKPILLRATQAASDETDVRCRLSESFPADRPPLVGVLSRASENEPIEWEQVGITEETARDLVDALQRHCQENGGEYRGLYRYRDQWFFISVTPRGTSTAGLDGGDHEHWRSTPTTGDGPDVAGLPDGPGPSAQRPTRRSPFR